MTAASLWLAIDANVYVAKFTQEEFSSQADNVFNSGALITAPDFIGIEVASAFLKKVRSGQMSLNDATAALDGLPRRVWLQASSPLWSAALRLAQDLRLTAYDALYASLALREHCRLVTADTQLRDALTVHAPSALTWLGDFIEPSGSR